MDGFRQTVQPQITRAEHDIPETLKSENFAVKKVGIYNFMMTRCVFFWHLSNSSLHNTGLSTLEVYVYLNDNKCREKQSQ